MPFHRKHFCQKLKKHLNVKVIYTYDADLAISLCNVLSIEDFLSFQITIVSNKIYAVFLICVNTTQHSAEHFLSVLFNFTLLCSLCTNWMKEIFRLNWLHYAFFLGYIDNLVSNNEIKNVTVLWFLQRRYTKLHPLKK